jgi:hypothetical protein
VRALFGSRQVTDTYLLAGADAFPAPVILIQDGSVIWY